MEFFRSSRLLQRNRASASCSVSSLTAHGSSPEALTHALHLYSLCRRPLAAETHATLHEKGLLQHPDSPVTPEISIPLQTPAELWIFSFPITGANWALTPPRK